MTVLWKKIRAPILSGYTASLTRAGELLRKGLTTLSRDYFAGYAYLLAARVGGLQLMPECLLRDMHTSLYLILLQIATTCLVVTLVMTQHPSHRPV